MVRPEVGAVLFIWFQQQRANSIPVSGTMLQSQAEELGRLTGGDFKFSNRWLDITLEVFNDNFSPEDDLLLKKVEMFLRENIQFKDYVNVDNNVITTEHPISSRALVDEAIGECIEEVSQIVRMMKQI
ncbi:hypothetical protein Trydic_g16700 [Trypoxylus dichotomus]